MTGSSSFDLTTEPWIPVLDVEGAVRELSPVEVVEQAHRLVAVVGELPTQGFALTRLLLAVLHRAVRGPADAVAWEELWRTDGLPVDDVARYLEAWRHRFDLFSADTPFFQVAGLATGKGEVSGLEKLIADIPNGHAYFTTRAGADLSRIGPAEAARWLVHAQAFNPSGIKSGAVGDDRVKGGRGYPIGIAWAGNLGGVLLQGTTLRDTLLLNLLPYQDAEMEWGAPEDDLPVWERPPITPAVELVDGIPRRRPRGPADLYTWPSRRVRLAGDAGGITGVLIANGDPLEPQNRHTVEPMSAWRRSAAQEKKRGEPLVYMPKEHSIERVFWRGLAALLPQGARRGQDRGGAQSLPPPVVEWLARVRYDDALPEEYPVRLRAVGLVYGSMDSVVTELIDDELSLSVAVLRASQPELGQEAVRAVGAAEHAVRALTRLAGNLAAAGGRDPEGAGARAGELGYAALDTPFRRWLADLRSDSVLHEVEEDWHRRVARIVRDLARDLVESAGAAAWKGREVNKRHLDAALADIFFDTELRKAVPRAFAEPVPAGR
ncbi:type I-E CRISPR-associated protein Cse1/CasA [Geodermatophilus chilensis]|uniref:type I-E CRISPR-associated protein Cse1/CasA n=1 Tax=Geodermatophilus chilensis TaxID=2035835 RepID=UPI000C267E0C|nr:type I-E CRISPR-associated protein Cse1/CasA [Geodermatophilus chilensis]